MFHTRQVVRSSFAFLSCGVVLALILAACGGAAPTAATAQPTSAPVTQPTEPPVARPTESPAKTEPGILRFGWTGQPDTLNPAYAFLPESFVIFDLIYNTLVKEDPNGQYVGDLATDWKVSEDGLTWTFTIHDNVKFHDGTPLTAEDVAWAINAVMQDRDGWAAVSDYTTGFKEVTAPDAHTVQIVSEYPIGNMPYRVTWLYTLPRKDFEGFKTAEELQNFINDKAVGTGAFQLTTFDKDKGIIILDANPDFFLGRPKIDRVIFQQFDNSDAMVQALKVGEVDALVKVPSTAIDLLKNAEGVKVVQQPSRSFDQLIINATPADHDPAPTRNPALEDPQVRLAIAQAINKQDLVDIVLQGLGKPGDTIIAPAMGAGFWHNPNIQDVPFDLEKANQILEEAGYVKGSDGVRAKGDTRLEFRLQYPSDSITYPRVASLMADWWKEIGIKTTPEAVDPDALIAASNAGDYDLVIWGWGGEDADPNFQLSTMTSAQFVPGGWSDSGYSNPKYDELFVKQQQTLDPDERQRIIWEMQEMIFNDRPYIVYWYPDTLQAYRADRFQYFIESPAVQVQDSDSLRQVEPVQ